MVSSFCIYEFRDFKNKIQRPTKMSCYVKKHNDIREWNGKPAMVSSLCIYEFRDFKNKIQRPTKMSCYVKKHNDIREINMRDSPYVTNLPPKISKRKSKEDRQSKDSISKLTKKKEVRLKRKFCLTSVQVIQSAANKTYSAENQTNKTIAFLRTRRLQTWARRSSSSRRLRTSAKSPKRTISTARSSSATSSKTSWKCRCLKRSRTRRWTKRLRFTLRTSNLKRSSATESTWTRARTRGASTRRKDLHTWSRWWTRLSWSRTTTTTYSKTRCLTVSVNLTTAQIASKSTRSRCTRFKTNSL